MHEKRVPQVYLHGAFFLCIHKKTRDGRLEAKARFSWIRNNHSKVNNVETNLKEILDY